MKRTIILVTLLVFTLICSTFISFADNDEAKTVSTDPQTTQVTGDQQDEDSQEAGKGFLKNQGKIEAKAAFEARKATLEEQKNAIESQFEALEKQIETAEAAGDTALVATLKSQLTALKVDLFNKKAEVSALMGKEPKKDMVVKIEAKNTWQTTKAGLIVQKETLTTEIEALEAQIVTAETAGDTALVATLKAQMAEKKTAIAKIKEDMEKARIAYKEEIAKNFKAKIKGKFKVFDADKLIIKGQKFEGETPPVINDGRIFIPLRAIASSLGAEVKYDQASKLVTVTKGEKVIIINLETKKITVNGEEVKMSAKAESFDNRLYVPFRFLSEMLGHKIDISKTGEVSIQ